jgi:Ca2+-binding RTX toxin-like protein
MAEFWGGSKASTLRGTSGADVFHGGTGDVVFVGNGGQDLFWGGYRHSYVDFRWARSPININLSFDGWQQTGVGWNRFVAIDGMFGTPLADRVLGSNSNDWLSGEGGNDYLWGGWGWDDLLGGEGNDTLEGGTGNDSLAGGNGNDILRGETGDDVLKGENGADVLNGGPGNDVMEGGYGDDLFLGSAGEDNIIGGPGRNTLDYTGSLRIDMNRRDTSGYWYTGDAAGDRISGIQVLILSGFNDNYEGFGESWDVYGGAGDDSITGSGGLDRLDGGEGNDILKGERENDSLFGGPGKDRLNGGSGTDHLAGGPGADTFIFETGGSTVKYPDRIADFEKGDRIDLSAIDARPGGVNDAFAFIGSAAFSGRGGELAVRANPGGGWLVTADTNGDRVADFALVVVAPAAPIASDFVL